MAAEHRADVEQFVRDEIDTVPHLEALLLVWRGRGKSWSEVEMASALYVPQEVAARILANLEEKELLLRVSGEEVRYCYRSGSETRDELISGLNAAYQYDLIRISRMIHSKAPSGVREFARSFRFTKEEK
jgi:hypothetical protein